MRVFLAVAPRFLSARYNGGSSCRLAFVGQNDSSSPFFKLKIRKEVMEKLLLIADRFKS